MGRSQVLYNRTKGRYRHRGGRGGQHEQDQQQQSQQASGKGRGKQKQQKSQQKQQKQQKAIAPQPLPGPGTGAGITSHTHKRRPKYDESILLMDQGSRRVNYYPTSNRTRVEEAATMFDMIGAGGSIDVQSMATTLSTTLSISQRLRVPRRVANAVREVQKAREKAEAEAAAQAEEQAKIQRQKHNASSNVTSASDATDATDNRTGANSGRLSGRMLVAEDRLKQTLPRPEKDEQRDPSSHHLRLLQPVSTDYHPLSPDTTAGIRGDVMLSGTEDDGDGRVRPVPEEEDYSLNTHSYIPPEDGSYSVGTDTRVRVHPDGQVEARAKFKPQFSNMPSATGEFTPLVPSRSKEEDQQQQQQLSMDDDGDDEDDLAIPDLHDRPHVSSASQNQSLRMTSILDQAEEAEEDGDDVEVEEEEDDYFDDDYFPDDGYGYHKSYDSMTDDDDNLLRDRYLVDYDESSAMGETASSGLPSTTTSTSASSYDMTPHAQPIVHSNRNQATKSRIIQRLTKASKKSSTPKAQGYKKRAPPKLDTNFEHHEEDSNADDAPNVEQGVDNDNNKLAAEEAAKRRRQNNPLPPISTSSPTKRTPPKQNIQSPTNEDSSSRQPVQTDPEPQFQQHQSQQQQQQQQQNTKPPQHQRLRIQKDPSPQNNRKDPSPQKQPRPRPMQPLPQQQQQQQQQPHTSKQQKLGGSRGLPPPPSPQTPVIDLTESYLEDWLDEAMKSGDAGSHAAAAMNKAAAAIDRAAAAAIRKQQQNEQKGKSDANNRTPNHGPPSKVVLQPQAPHIADVTSSLTGSRTTRSAVSSSEENNQHGHDPSVSGNSVAVDSVSISSHHPIWQVDSRGIMEDSSSDGISISLAPQDRQDRLLQQLEADSHSQSSLSEQHHSHHNRSAGRHAIDYNKTNNATANIQQQQHEQERQPAAAIPPPSGTNATSKTKKSKNKSKNKKKSKGGGEDLDAWLDSVIM